MHIIKRDEIPSIPTSVAVCRVCGSPLVIDAIDEYEEGGKVTKAGFHITCVTEPLDDDEWWGWHEHHFRAPYTDWVPVDKIVYEWFSENYRIAVEE